MPLVPEQGRLGRRLAIVRVYYRVGQKFPNLPDAQLMAHGATLLVSLDTRPGGPTYASIAAGREDATIRAFLVSMEQAAVRYGLAAVYFCFEHEANTAPHHVGLGSSREFVSAWDHIHQLAASLHVNWNEGGRLHWVWILTSGAFRRNEAATFWPGAGEVDIVAADGYNTAGCRRARAGTNLVAPGNRVESPAALFGPVLRFAESHGPLPVFIAEWGSVPYTSPYVQPRYILQMRTYVTDHPEIAAALYWNGHGIGNGCDYTINNYPRSVAAMAAMGGSPGLQGQLEPVAR
jgi:hypothetical protein